MKNKTSPSFSRKRLILYIIITWLSILVGLESVLYAVGFRPNPQLIVPAKVDKFRPDDRLIWGLKKNWKGFEVNYKPVSINSLGLRGEERQKHKDKLILFIGDSVVYGHLIGDKDTVPAQLEKQLSTYNGNTIQVMNAGVPGYSTFQEEKFYRYYGHLMKPDIVLIGFCLNDVTERYLRLSEYGGDRFFMANVDTEHNINRIKKIWLNSSIRNALIHLFRDTSKRFEEYRVEKLWKTPEPENIQTSWARVFSEIDSFAKDLTQDNIPFAVIIFPHRTQVAHKGLRIPQDRLIEYLKQKNIPYLDLLPFFIQNSTKTISANRFFLDGVHFSSMGADTAAYHIAGFLHQRGFIPFSQEKNKVVF